MPQIDKKDALEKLRKAKGAHIKWRAYAQALVSGVSVSEEKIPVEHTNCMFGKWYHGDGKTQLGHLSSYEGIYTPHEMLHEIYKRIFNVLQEPDTVSLKNLFSSRSFRENRRMEMARNYMEELVGVSETLLRALDMLEEEIREQPDS
ncbi:MAG: CZB domain-containing protein [Candidatus Thiodiazotropha sp.]